MRFVVAAITVAIPGLATWLWGRRLVTAIDPAQWPVRTSRALPRLNLLAATMATVPWLLDVRLPALWTAALWLCWRAGRYPLRRVMRGDSWSLPAFLWFEMRLAVTGFGFWLLLGSAPAIIDADMAGPIAPIALGVMLLLWPRFSGRLFRLLVAARPLLRTDVISRVETLAARTRVRDFRALAAGPANALWVRHVALLRDRVILLSQTLVDRLTSDELTALAAHALAQLDAFSRQRRPILNPIAIPVLLAVTVVPLVPWPGQLAWFAFWMFACWRGIRRHRSWVAVCDRPAADLLGDGEALVSALVKEVMLEQPRQLDPELGRRLAMESLRERIAAIRTPAAARAGAAVVSRPARPLAIAWRLRALRILPMVALVVGALIIWLRAPAAVRGDRTATAGGVPLSGVGKSYGHVALFGPTAGSVAAALTERQAAISPTVNGYTLIADEEFKSSDGKALAAELSQKLSCPAIVVSQYHEDVLYYTLFEAGRVTDEYDSNPDYYDFAFAHIPPRGPRGRDAGRLCSALKRTSARAAVDRILHKRGWLLNASDRHGELADALGMPKFAVGFGYGVLHGSLPNGLDESAVVLTTRAREFRDIERRLNLQPTGLPRSAVETLPSGKRIRRSYRPDNSLLSEFHLYGERKTAIGLLLRFRRGHKTSEAYFYGGHRVARDVYERERLKYPDMPAADASADDDTTDGLGSVQQELRWRAKIQAAATSAAEMDRVAIEAMNGGRRANASDWVQSNDHTIGEMDSATTRFLTAKLADIGAVAVFACRIRSYDDGFENTDHVVIELPPAPSARAAVIKIIELLIAARGFDRYPDNGQLYAYVKLD